MTRKYDVWPECSVPGCARRAVVGGECDRHYRATRQGRTISVVRPAPTQEERFWAKVNKDGPIHPTIGTACWEWTGGYTGDGYPAFKYDGRQIGAHRASWLIRFGEIPDGLCVLHECDHPPCIRHLFLGTQAENAADRDRKGRARVPRGAAQWCAKLTDGDVLEIRAGYVRGRESHVAIGRRYGVSGAAIDCIISRKTWRHV